MPSVINLTINHYTCTLYIISCKFYDHDDENGITKDTQFVKSAMWLKTNLRFEYS